MDDLISRQLLIDILEDRLYKVRNRYGDESSEAGICAGALRLISVQPPARPEGCEGCKHLRKWENEAEYGYPSPCTVCKRKARDYYER